jgi:glycosyltransferase involved in cell wall biosynthesis
VLKFSIIISCYNQESFIKEAVDSALAQPCDSKEIIVVDDASRDGSVRILGEYGDRIHLIKFEKNQGPVAARNAGVSIATGEFLVFLDGDDLFLPWALDTYLCIEDSKKPKIILCRLLFFKGQVPAPRFFEFGQEIQIVEYDSLIRKDRTFRCSASAIVVERQVFDAVGGWTQNFFPSETDDLLVKLGCSGQSVLILSHPTIAYRIHANNTVHQISRFLDKMHLVIRKEKMGGYPGGPQLRFERYAYIGGAVFFWLKRSLQAGLYWPAAKFLVAGWLMILTASVSKFGKLINGRRPAEKIAPLFLLEPRGRGADGHSSRPIRSLNQA